MASENQLVIEIVLDDGSIKQGFARVKSEAKKSTDEVAKNTEVSGKKLADNLTSPITSAFEKIGVTVSSRLVLIGAAAAATGIAIQQAFKFTLIGEEIGRITGQFDRFAASAGLFGPQLRQSLEAAGGGLVDMEQILDKSAATFAELGANAAKLPQILETARNIGVSTGRDVGEVFEALNRAILTGNTRGLQQIGIFIKADEVVNKYAASVGIATKDITEQVRQTALLEEVTGRLSSQFANAGAGLTPVKTAFTQLKVAFDDLFDSLGVRANQAFGGVFASATKLAADAVASVANAINPKAIETSLQAAEKIARLQQSIAENNATVERNLPSGIALNKQLNAELDRTIVLREELNRKESESLGSQIIAKDAEAAAVRTQQLKDAADAAAKLYLEQQKLQQLDYTAANASITSIGDTIGGVGVQFTTFFQALREQAAGMKVTFGELAGTVLKGFAQASGQAFAAFGAALQRGDNALEAFGQSLTNAFGNMLVQLGTGYILQGTAQAIATYGAEGLPLIGAGAALAAFGGLISASVSGGATAPSGGFSNSSGSFAEAGIGTAPGLATDNQEVDQREPTTEIVVNFEGANIMGDESAGRRIVELINSAFDSQGVKVRRGALA
jgi:hypothetical protein